MGVGKRNSPREWRLRAFWPVWVAQPERSLACGCSDRTSSVVKGSRRLGLCYDGVLGMPDPRGEAWFTEGGPCRRSGDTCVLSGAVQVRGRSECGFRRASLTPAPGAHCTRAAFEEWCRLGAPV